LHELIKKLKPLENVVSGQYLSPVNTQIIGDLTETCFASEDYE